MRSFGPNRSSLAANVAAVDPTMVGWVVGVCPPVALLPAWELLMQVRAPSAAVRPSMRSDNFPSITG